MGREMRKTRICKLCIYFMPDTQNIEAECEVEEDVRSTDNCEFYERKE